MNKQLYKDGDVIGEGDKALECVLVQWRDRDGEKENFVYCFRPVSDMETERKETSNPTPEEDK